MYGITERREKVLAVVGILLVIILIASIVLAFAMLKVTVKYLEISEILISENVVYVKGYEYNIETGASNNSSSVYEKVYRSSTDVTNNISTGKIYAIQLYMFNYYIISATEIQTD